MKIDESKSKGLLVFGLIIITLFLCPSPEGLSVQAWRVFAVFFAVIVSFILRPFPIGVMVMLGLLILVLTRTIEFKESLYGFGDSTVWLVVAAFLIAGAVIDTGLGKRIALSLIVKFGKTIQGMAYAICGAELMLGTIIPSNTARGGGILAPIVNALSHSLNSYPDKDAERAGSYLSLVGAHANLIAAAMFMTGMAANPLITKAAQDIFGISFGWGTWALGSIVPGLISFAFLPIVLSLWSGPTANSVGSAREEAVAMKKSLGVPKKAEKIMFGVLILLLTLWVSKFIHGIDTTAAAWLGILLLVLSRAYSWDQVISNKYAWDSLIWLGGLLTMANLLMEYGFIKWMTDHLTNMVIGYSALMALLFLAVVYFYTMYAFSMLTGHIAAMAAPFLAVCLAVGADPYLSVALFAYFSCLCGCTTYYSSGPVIIYFGLGYVSPIKWLKVGFLMSLYHLVVWIGVGLIWWKILGWW